VTPKPAGERPAAEQLADAVRKRRERRDRWLAEGPRALLRNLGMVGALGWLVVVPTVAGALAGRWIDRRTGAGIFWSATCIFAGVVLGGWLVWQKVNKS
jgi:ATP synthase protein I